MKVAGCNFYCHKIIQEGSVASLCRTRLIGNVSASTYAKLLTKTTFVLTETGVMELDNQLVYVGNHHVLNKEYVECHLVVLNPTRRIHTDESNN